MVETEETVEAVATDEQVGLKGEQDAWRRLPAFIHASLYATPAAAGGRDATGVFNAAFVTCMARFGFSTLAAWSGVDTMHFDFQEGFDGIQSHDLYSP